MTSNRRAAADAVVLDLPSLVAGIPAPPDPSLDPYLDAAARCFRELDLGSAALGLDPDPLAETRAFEVVCP